LAISMFGERLLEQSWAEYFGPLNEKLSSGSEPEIFGLKVKGFEWYGTDDLLEKFRSLSASLGISWGEGFSESYVTVKADIEKAHGGPVVFLSAEDFAAVFNSLTMCHRQVTAIHPEVTAIHHCITLTTVERKLLIIKQPLDVSGTRRSALAKKRHRLK
jgi:hypothetical protein